MCSYASVNGVPACASRFISQEKARGEWNFSGYVVTDCGAVNNMVGGEHYAANGTDAAAKALDGGGVDINCGGGLTGNVCAAIGAGLVGEGVLDASLKRSLGLLFQAGMFDPVDDQPYTRIPFEALGSPENRERAMDAARQAQVLLKNDGGVLPLRSTSAATGAGLRIAVVGPHAQTQLDLAGNYFEDICEDGATCVETVEAAVRRVHAAGGGGATVAEPGCPSIRCDVALPAVQFAAAVAAAGAADAVVLAMGLTTGGGGVYDASSGSGGGGGGGGGWSNSSRRDGMLEGGGADGTEGEGHDRMNIALPDGQQELIRRVLQAVADSANPSKPVVVVLFR
jgi:hypothetical protein